MSPEFTKWKRDTEIAIERMFGAQTRNLDDFNRVRYSLGMFMTDTPDREFAKAYRSGLEHAAAVLDSMIWEIEEYSLEDDAAENAPDQLAPIEKLCLCFHTAARQLQNRNGDRDALI